MSIEKCNLVTAKSHRLKQLNLIIISICVTEARLKICTFCQMAGKFVFFPPLTSIAFV